MEASVQIKRESTTDTNGDQFDAASWIAEFCKLFTREQYRKVVRVFKHFWPSADTLMPDLSADARAQLIYFPSADDPTLVFCVPKSRYDLEHWRNIYAVIFDVFLPLCSNILDMTSDKERDAIYMSGPYCVIARVLHTTVCAIRAYGLLNAEDDEDPDEIAQTKKNVMQEFYVMAFFMHKFLEGYVKPFDFEHVWMNRDWSIDTMLAYANID